MPQTMLAVVKPEAAPGAEIREVKVPGFGRNDVLVKVKVASICGTDLHMGPLGAASHSSPAHPWTRILRRGGGLWR
jgi:D-arabinose 1-dehydrogenase-like Zn-dependent alcohol dehydrogenase